MPRTTRRCLAALLAAVSIAPCHGANDEAERGRALLRAYHCGSCHTIPGVRGAHGRFAAPLTAFAQRAFIAGRLPNTPDNLARWVMDAPAIDAATAMPKLGLDPGEARAIVVYLYSLD